jgi:hypothetical protein
MLPEAFLRDFDVHDHLQEAVFRVVHHDGVDRDKSSRGCRCAEFGCLQAVVGLVFIGQIISKPLRSRLF